MSLDSGPPGSVTGDGPYPLHDNVAEDLVKYVRSNTIRNEQQFLLTTLGYLTGFFRDPHHYVSGVLIGTSSSGKTHLQDKVENLFDSEWLYQTTSGSAKSMIYDEEWDSCDIASLDELQKPPVELIEFLKSVHGGDEEFIHKVTQGSVRDGFGTEEIVRKSKPYWFLYAQWDADFEMWNRLLKIPVHESESKNRAVFRMAFDEDHIQLENDENEYGFDFSKGVDAIHQHFFEIREDAPGVVIIPNNLDQFEVKFADIVEPIFNHSRSEANRLYFMVSNLIRASALLNYHRRETVTADLGYDDGPVEALVAEPQDVANVLMCRHALLASTHEIDRKKRMICEAIKQKGGNAKVIDGLDPILEFLREADAPVVKKDEIVKILEDLEQNHLVKIYGDAGTDGDEYEFLEWDQLGKANVKEYEQIFSDCTDPFTGNDFVESWREMREEMDTSAQDLLGKATVSSQSQSSVATNNDGNAGLGSFGAGSTDDDLDLDRTEREVLRYVGAVADGERIENLADVPVEAFLGIEPLDGNGKTHSADGTLLDPTHDVWQQPESSMVDASAMPTTQKQARRKVKQTIDSLIKMGLIGFAQVHETDIDGRPVDATLSVTRS